MAGTIKVIVNVSPWLRIYLRSITLFCCTFNTEPDYAKLYKMIRKGIFVTHDG